MRIHPREMIAKAWSSESDNFRFLAPNIVKMIELFDRRSYWVSTEVVAASDSRIRATILIRFLEIAWICKAHGNFQTVFEIMNGLTAPSVKRLKQTWGQLSPLHNERFKLLHEFTSSTDNYKHYREAMARCGARPRIPYLAVTLKDLFTIEEGLSSTLEGLIHVHKLERVAEIVEEFVAGQSYPYTSSGSECGNASALSSARARQNIWFLSENEARNETKLNDLLTNEDMEAWMSSLQFNEEVQRILYNCLARFDNDFHNPLFF